MSLTWIRWPHALHGGAWDAGHVVLDISTPEETSVGDVGPRTVGTRRCAVGEHRREMTPRHTGPGGRVPAAVERGWQPEQRRPESQLPSLPAPQSSIGVGFAGSVTSTNWEVTDGGVGV